MKINTINEMNAEASNWQTQTFRVGLTTEGKKELAKLGLELAEAIKEFGKTLPQTSQNASTIKVKVHAISNRIYQLVPELKPKQKSCCEKVMNFVGNFFSKSKE